MKVIAQPFATWDPAEPDFDSRLRDLTESQAVERVVLGFPLSLGGREGAAAREVMAFSDRIRSATGLEVVLVDERFTSIQAERALLEGDVRRRARRQRRDRVAAALILQSYLERTR